MRKADTGIFNTQRVKLAFADSKHEVNAYAKKLSEMDFLVEILSALLGREIGLPIPEPIVAITSDNSDILFASVDVNYPDLTRSLSILDGFVEATPSNRSILKKLSDWANINQAIGFDEWIANGDRNPGMCYLTVKINFFNRPQFSYAPAFFT